MLLAAMMEAHPHVSAISRLISSFFAGKGFKGSNKDIMFFIDSNSEGKQVSLFTLQVGAG